MPTGVTVHVNEEDGDVNIETPTSLQVSDVDIQMHNIDDLFCTSNNTCSSCFVCHFC